MSEAVNLNSTNSQIGQMGQMSDAGDIYNFATQNPVTKEMDGIEILVQMAKQGKLNPWSLDIVDVTDKYLAQLFEMKSQNLRLTGRTLLFAAILLKLKSNILANVEITDFDNMGEDEFGEFDHLELDDDFQADYEDELPTNNVISLDEVLQRRTSVRLNRSRVVTLKDLIRQLEFYEMIDKKQSMKNAHERAKRRVRNYANLSADDIVNLAHDEYIDKGVQTLKANLEQILFNAKRVELTELTLLGMDKISAYISLLFLSANSDYELTQDEFYGELYVVKSTLSENFEEDLAISN